MLSPRERPKRCENCRLMFKARVDAKFCSGRCRQAGWRRRAEPAIPDGGLVPTLADLVAPTLADLENWLNFGRHDPHHRANMAANRATGADYDAGRKRAVALITLKKSPGGV